MLLCLVAVTSTVVKPAGEMLTRIESIEIEFAKMTIEIKKALISNKVDVEVLIELLCAISAVRNKNVPLFDNDVFEKVKSINDFWKELRGFWTIFDYDVLKYIIEVSQCEKAQKIFEEFLSRIDPSTIEDVDLVLHCTEERWKGSLKPVLRIKVKTDKCTLNVKNAVKEIVSKVYELDKFALHFQGIKKGCIELLYHISTPLKLHLLHFEATRSDMDVFVAHDIVSLHVDEHELKPYEQVSINIMCHSK